LMSSLGTEQNSRISLSRSVLIAAGALASGRKSSA
jgi:hypothetical protein